MRSWKKGGFVKRLPSLLMVRIVLMILECSIGTMYVNFRSSLYMACGDKILNLILPE